jgi:hypothetical protein
MEILLASTLNAIHSYRQDQKDVPHDTVRGEMLYQSFTKIDQYELDFRNCDTSFIRRTPEGKLPLTGIGNFDKLFAQLPIHVIPGTTRINSTGWTCRIISDTLLNLELLDYWVESCYDIKKHLKHKSTRDKPIPHIRILANPAGGNSPPAYFMRKNPFVTYTDVYVLYNVYNEFRVHGGDCWAGYHFHVSYDGTATFVKYEYNFPFLEYNPDQWKIRVYAPQ